MSSKRQAAEARGRRAETLAAWMLRLKGYRIVATRLRTPLGEIDLVAKRGKLLVIVEVKTRASADEAIASVSARQQQRLAAAAGWLPSWRPGLADCDIRFDVVAMAPGRWPQHIQNAWISN